MQIPSGFVKVSSLEIKDYTERFTETGELLRSAFLQGPSASVREYGEIKIELKSEDSEEPSKEETKPDNKSAEQSNKEQQSSEKPSGETQSAEKSSSDNAQPGKESFSIFNSYYNLRKIMEADDDAGKSVSKAGKEQTKPIPSDNGDKKKFTPGEIIQVRSLLKENGCTIWDVQIDKNVQDNTVNQIKTLFKNNKFRDAYNIASKSVEGQGFTVLSASTYINKNDSCHAPFMGYCRFGFDAGTKGDASDHTVCIAVAPLDAKTMKPKEKTVFTAIYDITGDISGGQIDALKSISDKDGTDDNEDRWSSEPEAEKNITDDISKYLHDNFKTAGDSKMFDDFVTAKKFVGEKLKDGSLQFNSDKSTSVANYASKLGDSFIHY